MPESVRRSANRHEEPEVIEDSVAPVTHASDTDIDAILDEIDGVLEENAEEFVRSFVQKGGQ